MGKLGNKERLRRSAKFLNEHAPPRLLFEKYLVKFYVSITADPVDRVEQIPAESLKVLKWLEYEDLIKPFIVADLKKGLSRNQIHIKYKVPVSFARFLGEKAGIYESRY